MEDREIIELYFRRDERAIRETDRKYGRLCFSLSRNILASGEDARECVSDAYLALWRRIPPERPENLMAYLAKIVRNLSLKRLDHDRAKKRCPELLLSFEELEAVLPDERFTAQADGAALASLLGAFLRQETPTARSVFLRRYWFFDSVRDIASRFNFSESKVKSILFRTRRRLRAFLKKEGIDV